MLCYASGIDEPEAVRETVAILKQADLAPLDVAGHGTIEDRLTDGRKLRRRARIDGAGRKRK